MSDSDNGDSPDDEKKVLSIYNPTNHLVNSQVIKQIFEICELNYKPQNIQIFQQGLTHKSYVVITNPEIEFEHLDNCVELQQESNERLEYLGDSIIGAIVASYLYHRYYNQNEGFLTKIKTKLVRTNMLAKFSLYIGLDKHVLISKHVEDMCEGRTNERILEDTFEAFIGALFEDIYQDDNDKYGRAMQLCADFIIRLIEDTTDFRQLIAINDNYKELLLQLYHKTWNGIHPIYNEIKVDGPTNKRIYTMGVYHPVTKQLIGQGTARKKTMAEQTASKEALDYFKQYPPQIEKFDEKSKSPTT
jgi:ribonuclease III